MVRESVGPARNPWDPAWKSVEPSEIREFAGKSVGYEEGVAGHRINLQSRGSPGENAWSPNGKSVGPRRAVPNPWAPAEEIAWVPGMPGIAGPTPENPVNAKSRVGPESVGYPAWAPAPEIRGPPVIRGFTGPWAPCRSGPPRRVGCGEITLTEEESPWAAPTENPCGKITNYPGPRGEIAWAAK